MHIHHATTLVLRLMVARCVVYDHTKVHQPFICPVMSDFRDYQFHTDRHRLHCYLSALRARMLTLRPTHSNTQLQVAESLHKAYLRLSSNCGSILWQLDDHIEQPARAHILVD